MRPYVRLAFVVPLFAVCHLPAADTALIDAVTKDVKDVCSQPATQGQHWSVHGEVNADAGIQLKLLKLASVKGNLQFTKEEWSGVQRVLAADQAGVYDSYTKCVQALVPEFLAKVPNAK
jgi:hypothetical protein